MMYYLFMMNNANKPLQVYMSPNIRNKLFELAKSKGQTESAMVRILIDDGWEKIFGKLRVDQSIEEPLQNIAESEKA